MRSGVCSPQLAPAPRPESRLSGHSGPGPATASRAAPPAVRSARGQPLHAGRRLRGLGDGEGAGCPREDKTRKGERAGRRPAAPRLQPAVRDVPDAGVCWGRSRTPSGPRVHRPWGAVTAGGRTREAGPLAGAGGLRRSPAGASCRRVAQATHGGHTPRVTRPSVLQAATASRPGSWAPGEAARCPRRRYQEGAARPCWTPPGPADGVSLDRALGVA